jgi:hypothetical protein
MRTKKPRSSGFIETLVKAAFGFGTTVHHSTDFLGRRKKVVVHHDSGKSKHISHGHGFLGNVTHIEKRHGNAVVETSTHKRRFWGGHDRTTHKANGNRIDSEHRPGFFRSHGSRRVSGSCWPCEGTGTFPRTGKTCRRCGGSGLYTKSQSW